MTEVMNIIDSVFNYKLFEINQTPVTLSSIIMFILIFAIFYIVSRLIDKLFIRRLLRRLQVEDSKAFTMSRITHYLIMISGTVIAFQFIGIDLSGLAVIFGLLSVGIGFGLQNVTSNFIAGLILLLERPIKIGDRVTVGGTEGDVTAINIRSTTIRSLNNISIIVPNSEFVSSQVINWSHGDARVRLDVPVGVSYNSDLDKVNQALLEVAAESNVVLKNPTPDVLFDGFGDSAWNMRLRVWLKDPVNYYSNRSEINCAIVRTFRHYGIEIPYPQHDLHVRSPLPVPLKTEVNN
jgi:small-conductance mechanosensitive channel